MKNELRNELVTYFVTMGLVALFCVFWQVLELMIYGQIQHRIVDDIISIPVTLSFYYNIRHWLEDK